MNALPADAPPLDQGAVLLQLLQGRRLEGFEKSFKMVGGTLLADRFLAGIHKTDISPVTLFSLCKQLGMPERFQPAFEAHAEGANAFHFGYEAKGARALYKVYLEYASRLQDRRLEASQPVLLHLAYKWDVSHPQSATVARYECHPGLPLSGILDSVARLFADPQHQKAHAAVRAILALSAVRTDEPPMYLEVAEEDNPRASFDIKLHDAEICIGEIKPLLMPVAEHLGIRAVLLEPILETLKDRPLGHLSGGINRDGEGFLTVYYPAEAP